MVENKGSEELQNHLATFKAFSIDTSVPLDGTIIRIPLRTKEQASESKIVQKEVTVQNIKDALALLGKEVRQGGLLFLKHVRKMRVRVDGQVMWEARMEERDLGHPRSGSTWNSHTVREVDEKQCSERAHRRLQSLIRASRAHQ